MTSHTYPPRKPSAQEVLVAALETYAAMRSHNAASKAELRMLAWFLRDMKDRGEDEAAKAIMKHTDVVEPS